MVREEKYYHALYALHQIYVGGRFMAYQRKSYEDIARLLDYAEIMPEFLASENDETDRFLGFLDDIVKNFPDLKYILTAFNSENSPYGFMKNERTL